MTMLKLYDSHYKEAAEIRYGKNEYQLEADSICHTESDLIKLMVYAVQNGFTKVMVSENRRKMVVMN